MQKEAGEEQVGWEQPSGQETVAGCAPMHLQQAVRLSLCGQPLAED